MKRNELRSKLAKLCLNGPTGLDPLYELGAGQPRGEYVLVMAVSDRDIEDGAIIRSVDNTVDVRKANLFEVVGKGSLVPDDIQVGDFCTSLATMVNPVNGLKQTAYALVHHETIASRISADEASRCIPIMEKEREKLRADNLGLGSGIIV